MLWDEHDKEKMREILMTNSDLNHFNVKLLHVISPDSFVRTFTSSLVSFFALCNFTWLKYYEIIFCSTTWRKNASNEMPSLMQRYLMLLQISNNRNWNIKELILDWIKNTRPNVYLYRSNLSNTFMLQIFSCVTFMIMCCK